MTQRVASIVPRSIVPWGVLWGLTAAGLLLASIAALRGTPGSAQGGGGAAQGRGVDALELAHVLERERAVEIVGFTAGDARLLTVAWAARGVDTSEGDNLPHVVFVASGDERAQELLRRVGLDVDLTVEAVTVTREDPERPGRPATFVLGRVGSDALGRAVTALTRDLPPTLPRVTVYTADGRRRDPGLAPPVFETVTEGSTRTRLTVEVGTPPSAFDVARRVARAVGVVRESVPGSETLAVQEILIVRSIDARSLDGAVDDPAWYDPHQRMLVGIAGVTDIEVDLVEAYTSWLYHAAFGAPAETWLAEGIVSTVSRVALESQGRSAAQSGASGADLTWDEAVGAQLRTHAAGRGVRRQMAAFAIAGGDGPAGAREWAAGLSSSARASLRTAWDAQAFRSQPGSAAADRHVARKLPRAVAVRLAGAPSRSTGMGTRHTLAQLERIAELGFGAVVLNVLVPVAPPAALLGDADRRSPLEFAAWGRRVTYEGDGAVLAVARHAQNLGLEVVLWPHFVAGAAGPLVTQQVYPSGPAIEGLAARYVLAVEGVAHLAERAGASALVLFDTPLFPLPREANPRVRAARRSLRRQALAFAAPFRGELLAFSAGVPHLERAAAVADLADGPAFGFEIGQLPEAVGNPESVYRIRLQSATAAAAGRLHAVDVRLDGDDAARRTALLRACASALRETPSIDFVMLSYWGLGAVDPRDRGADERAITRDARIVPDDTLRAFAGCLAD